MKKFTITCIIFIFLIFSARGSDLVDLLPLTNNILIVHFKDGYAVHHKRGQQRGNESVVTDPLDIAKAMMPGSYSISSGDDGFYGSPLNPSSIGRKSKGTEYGLLCDTYNNGCFNSQPDYASEHWVYIYLPSAMVSGKTYTIVLSSLAKNNNTVTFKYDETQLRSEAIHVNNLGFSTAAPAKYGYIYHWAGDKGGIDFSSYTGKNFRIYNTDTKSSVFTGQIAFRKDKMNAETGQSTDSPNANFSSADVYECDFSAFNTPGNYVLSVDGMGCSFPFVINADAYREPYFWTMKGLFMQRSGIELKAPFADFSRPVPHNPTLTPGFSGRLKYSTFRAFDLTNSDGDVKDKAKVEAGYKGTLNTYGWYQDAGDWDGYYLHSNIPAFLMFLYESGRNKFTDNELNIPESGNGIPDILDEAAWLMRYYKRTKDEVKQKGWGTGGVAGARVFGDLWGGDTRADGTTKGSWEDTDRDWYVLGEDVWTTYKYAALCAQMAFILASEGKTDPENVNWGREAVDAYAWAQSNSKPADEGQTNLGTVTLKDTRMYASASLYRLTNDVKYHTLFLSDAQTAFLSPINQDQREVMFAAFMYLNMPATRTIDNAMLTNVTASVTNATETLLNTNAEKRACRWGGDFYFPMLIGQPTTPGIMVGLYGYLANKNNAAKAGNYLKYIHTTADYFLGTNPINTTWISGVGERYPKGIFKLDWWYCDTPDKILKGVVPYGPWRVGDFGPLGWWNPNWAWEDASLKSRVYPTDINIWPGHERWFDQRTSPLSCEYTIHQNGVIAAFTYGFLTADKETKNIVDVNGSVTALEEANADQLLIVYPNPSDRFITVKKPTEFHVQTIQVYDVKGRKVLERNTPKFDNDICLLDLHQLSGGNYILKFTTENGKVLNRKIFMTK